ncbi:unnamed protein product [Closterium sp. NIES-54]
MTHSASFLTNVGAPGDLTHVVFGNDKPLPVVGVGSTRLNGRPVDITNGDVTKAIQEWALEVCDDDKKRIKAIRTDGGGEFVNAELEKWMKSKGIKHDVTTPYTPQQNRAAERLNRTLVEAVRSLLQHSKLGSEWWGEASSLAAWIRNCLPMKVLPEMTPFEAWTGMKPNLSRLHTFGCLCYYHVLDPLRHKLQSKARAAIYLGIAVNERSWRVWDLGERRVVTSRDVVFDEDKFPKKEQPTPQLTVILPAQEEDEAMEVPSQVEKKAENGGGENEESDDDVVEVSSTAAATSSTPSSLPLALTREQRTRRPNTKYTVYATHPHRQAEPRRPAAPRSQEPSRTARPSRAALLSLRRHTEPHYPARATPAATAVSAATAATAATAAMASPIVLTFDAEGRAVDFDVWVDDMQLFLQCDSKDGVSLFYHTSGVSPTPAATADSMRATPPLPLLPSAASCCRTCSLTLPPLPQSLTSLLASALVTPATELRFPLSFVPRTLRRKGEVTEVLIDWIRSVRRQLSESFGSDLPVLRLHSDIGSEFPSDLLRAFYRAEGIRQTFTLPASPQQNGIAERYIGMVMDVARMSMIHAAAPHFLWPFAVQYAAHLINLQPHVSFPETTPTLRWTGKVGDASVFRVKGSRAFIRDTSADKLSSCAVLCVFLGFPPDAPGWQFYHPTSRRVLSSQDVTFDESVSYYRLFPYRTAPLPPPPLFLAPGAPLVDPLPPQGPAPSGVSQVDPVEPVEVAVDSGAARGAEPAGAGPRGAEPGPGGAEPGGAKSGGAEPGGAEPERAKSGGPPGVPSRREPLSPQQLCEWYARRCSRAAGATGPTAGAAGAAGPGGAGAGGTGAVGGPASVGAAGGAIAAGSGGARTGGTGATGAGGAAGVGAGVVGGAAGAGGTGVVGGPAGVGATGGARTRGAGAVATGGAARAGAARGTGAGGAAGVVAGDPGVDGTGAVSAVSGGAARPRPYYVPLLQQVLGLPPSTGPTPPLLSPPPVQSQSQLQPASPLPGPSPYSGPTRGLTERREPESRPASPESRPASLESSPESPVRTVRTGRRVPHQLPPPVPGTHSMTLRPSTAPQRLPLPTPPASSLPDGPYPESDSLRAASPPVTRFLTSVVTDPSFESAAASALVAELVDFAAACRLDYAASLVAESKSAFPARGDLAALRCPLGFTGSFPAGTQWSLRRPVYGLCQAPREWHDTLKTTLAALGFAPSTADPLLFLRTDTTLPPFYVLVYVDDLVFATADTEGFAHMNSEQQKRHTCTDLGELTSYLGWRITRDRAQRTITLTQSQVECSTLGMGLVLGGRARVVLAGHADASWVDELATLRSSQGYTFSLGSGSVSWRSTRSSSVLSSSCEAEIYVGAMAAQELRWLTYLLTDLGEAPRYPPVLYVDNKVMLALCQEHRLEHRTKHIALRYFLARELQQRGQLRLAYVAIQANTADIFTKALQPCDHQRFCIMLGCVHCIQFFCYRVQLSCCPSVRPSIVATIVPHSPMDSSQQSSAAGDETKCRPEEAREGENGQGEEFHDVEEQNGHHKQEHDSHDNNHNHHHHHHHLRLPFHHHQPTPEEEAAKVEELRAAIGPVDGAIALFCTDACLRRYLRARSWHVKKAEKMLLETIAWRRAFTPERIRWADVAKESETGKVYRAPFTDKLGRPVLVLCPGKQNTDDHDGNIRQMVYCMENAVQSLPEGVEQMVWIIDYKGFTLRKSPPMKTSREVLHILQNHYPERLGAAILFDPPYIFQGLWKVGGRGMGSGIPLQPAISTLFSQVIPPNPIPYHPFPSHQVIRPFIDPVTFQKIKFVYRKSLPSLKVMEELFDTSLLDPALGGKGDAYVYDHASYSSRMEADDERTAKLWELDGINGAARDETGVIVFTARNEQVDVLKEGATVNLRNAKIDMFRGSMRLAVDKWGLVEPTEDASFKPKEDNNLSLVEYELVNVVDE